MEKILFVNACVRKGSRTLALASHVLGKLSGTITEVDLSAERMSSLDWSGIEKRNALAAAGQLSAPELRHAVMFSEADTIVIAAPYWDFAFPAILKTYLEHVTVIGVTFGYSPKGEAEGLCKARRIIYVTTSGGAIGGRNFGFEYVKTLAGCFYGIPEAVCFSAENLDIEGNDVSAIIQKGIEAIDASGLE